MADYNSEFGAAVQRALGDRSYRKVAKQAGISASYIGDLVQGRIPARAVVVALAEATGANPNELLRLAGYAPLEDGGPEPERYEPDLSEFDIASYRGAESLSPRLKEQINSVVRALIAQEHREQGRES